jgi:hypothetical protein
MFVKLEVRHNLIGAMGGHRVGVEDARQFTRRLRPNAFEAVALFESDWCNRVIEAPVDGILALTVMLDHVGTGRSSRRVTRTPNGWSGQIHLDRRTLTANGRERPIGEIADELEFQAQDILQWAIRTPTDLNPWQRPPEARN